MRFVPGSLRRSLTTERLLVAFAAIPFVASLGFHSVDRVPSPLRRGPARPSLVFEQYFVNLDDVHNSPRIEAMFRFKNCGDRPARIVGLEPSCGCLDPKIEKRVYQPGEVCEFELGVLTTHQTAGSHEYTLAINYEDPLPRSVEVGFRVAVRREVRVNPPQLMVFQNGVNETTQTVVITDMRSKPFRVTRASCKSSLVNIQIGEPIASPDGGRDTSIKITVAASVPLAGEDTTVILETDDPVFRRIPVPLIIRDIRMPLPIRRHGGASEQKPLTSKSH